MTRSVAVLVGSLLALVVLDGPAFGQASVEYGTGAAAASGSAGPLKGLSDTLKSVLGRSAVKSSPDTSVPTAASKATTSTSSRTPSRPATRKKTAARPSSGALATPVAAPVPKPTYEDPNQIKVGMDYDELLRRFGPPTIAFAHGPSGKTLSYFSKDGPMQVEFEDGKVTAAAKSKS